MGGLLIGMCDRRPPPSNSHEARRLSSVTHSLYSLPRVLTLATQQLLNAHGCGVALIKGAGPPGLATLTHEQVKAGGKLSEVARARITESGRDALAAES